ncbi:ABC transporter substrate-binding protein [Parasporobacterium paucivorans]|uniref:Branched-chain amino acid transport system substrate-binding protein n=1 Tax=Parasporobacterium paucivorans DSM 15970 TaxID=1122934 RepID=A0A1M6LQ07_9FIRM|nr:ABC transporter substrate-binding protein [Parasporobacterium paucivorans]SHJ73283.1 branched-chain amino acid transport system substrate-binding protein [Parasporobacterium paucivorans DSM 15970]
MKKITKVFALLLSLVLLVPAVLAGCGSGGTDETTSGAGTDKTEIVIGYVAPFTGPLSMFTVNFDWVMEKSLEKINADGGIYIKAYDKKLPVRVIKADSESNATKASEVASKLVLDDKVDILTGSWTPETSTPVAAIAERYQVPCLISNSPADSWLAGGPYTWSYGIMFYVEDMMTSYIDALDKLGENNKKVGFLFDSEVDGVTFSAMLAKMLPERGYEVVDPGRFTMATTDYTNIITQLKSADCDIVIGNQILPNFTTAWGQFKQLGYVPKAMIIGKAIAYGSDVAALGEGMGEGLMTENHWDRTLPFTSSLLGLTCEEIAAAWETEKGTQYPATSLGWDIALFEVLNETFTSCENLEPATIRDAIAAVDYEGVYGKLSFDEKHIMAVPLSTAQWTKSDKWQYEANIVAAGKFSGVTINTINPEFIPGYTVK